MTGGGASPRLDVAMLPAFVDPGRTAVAVVIDVLRASTTMTEAIGNGAARIYTAVGVDEARALRSDHPNALLCGERGGLPPEGFDLGNSPLTYTPGRVGSREMIMSTTNGTGAIASVPSHARVLIGTITNRSAVADRLAQFDTDTALVCAGTEGRVSLDDLIGAGLIADALLARSDRFEPTDTAIAARALAMRLCHEHGSALGALKTAAHARRLVDLGFGDDVDFAGVPDSSGVVPELDHASGSITRS